MNIPEISIRNETVVLTRGTNSLISLTLEIPHDIHIQAHTPAEKLFIPTTVTFKKEAGITFGVPQYPEPTRLPMSWSPVALLVYSKEIEIKIPMRISLSSKPGLRSIDGQLSFQACTERYCLPPQTQLFQLHLSIQD